MEPLGDELRAEKSCSSHIPAWSSKASDQLVLDRIGHADHDNGNDAGRLFERPRGRRTQCDDDIKPVSDELGRDFAQSIGVRFAKPALDSDILPFDITKLAQPGHHGVESQQGCVSADRAAGREEADPRHSSLLRARRERPCDSRAAE